MRKIFKKINILFIALTLVLVLSACDTTVETVECQPGFELVGDSCDLIPVVDLLAPVLSGETDLAYTIGDDTPDYSFGLSANDDIDGDITSLIIIDSTLVDLTVEGSYVVTATISDVAGNSSEITFNVLVSPVPLTDEEKAMLDIAALDLSEELNLPTSMVNGSSLYWTSSDPLIITNRGFIIPPPVGSGTTVVTLTARVVNGEFEVNQEFDITVEPWGEVEVTSKSTIPFVGTSEEYVVDDDPAIDIYYVDNGALPYIDIETYLNMIDGAIEAAELIYTPIGDDQLEISYDLEYEDYDGSIVNETLVALVDFTENTFHVDTYDFFENYVASTESDFGDGLSYVDADYVDSVPVTIPLGEYNFDIIIYDDNGTLKYLMPFHVTNLLFAGGVYYDAYYNGETIYGIDTFGISGLDETDPLYVDIRTSSLNTENIPVDVKWASYNMLALTFDYFYGLKEDQDVDTYYSILVNRAQTIIEGYDSTLNTEIFKFAYALDDLHTSYVFPGIYSDPPYYKTITSIDVFGPRSQSFYEDGIWDMQDLITAKYGSFDNRPEFELLDDEKTAVIHIDGFSIDTPDDVKVILDGLPSTVVNVVFDLSYNTGGNIGAVFRLFGYMTEDQFTYHSQNPADDSAITVYIESDYIAYDYNWYIVSSKVSFSAANLMISMAKENGIATIMGTQSSGGASSIGAFYTPDGTALLISTNSVLSTRVGNEIDGYEYLSIEYGIIPDYIMDNVISDAEIISVINQHQAE